MNAAKKLLFLVIACLVILLFCPFEKMVVPEWKLRIVDQTGQPLRGNLVRQSWRHWTLENQGHEEELRSDGDGYVDFPRRMIRTNLLIWAGKFLIRLPNVHSSYGPSASIYYLGDYKQLSDDPWYEPGRELAGEIVVFRP